MTIRLKEDLIVELTLMCKYGIITELLFSKYASPKFAQRKPNGKLRLPVDLGKSTVSLRMIKPIPIIQLALCQTQHNNWQGSFYSASLHAPKLITACRWQTSGQWTCSQSISLAKFLPTIDLHKVLADLRLLFRVSCVSSWIQSSKLTNVLNTCTTLEPQPIMQRTSLFMCIHQTGLKLTVENCHFGVRQFEFLGRKISPVGISPQVHKIQNFVEKFSFPVVGKGVTAITVLREILQKIFPSISEKFNPIYKLLKTEGPINITSELKEIYNLVNKTLRDACELALKQPIPGK